MSKRGADLVFQVNPLIGLMADQKSRPLKASRKGKKKLGGSVSFLEVLTTANGQHEPQHIENKPGKGILRHHVSVKEEGDVEEENLVPLWQQLTTGSQLIPLDEKSLRDMSIWLDSLSLPGEYLKILVDAGVDDMSTVSMMRREDLESFGIVKKPHLVRLCDWIEKNRAEEVKQYFAEMLNSENKP